MAERHSAVVSVMETVNGFVEGHGSGVISPQAIRETRRANCLGIAGMVGAGAIRGNVEEESLGLLICVNHGAPRDTSASTLAEDYWLGHAMLTVAGEEPLVVDATDHAFLRKLGWEAAQEGGIVGFPQDQPGRLVTDMFVLGEVTQGRQGMGPPVPNTAADTPNYTRGWALRPFFGAYGLRAGMEWYQDHPLYRDASRVRLEDYLDLYDHITGGTV